MPKVYEAGGTIEINKPDASLNFQNSATFSLDYYDPTELETELKILQSDLLALQVIRELNLDRGPDLAAQAPPSPSPGSCSRSAAGRSRARGGRRGIGFKGSLRVDSGPEYSHHRSSLP